MSATVTTIKNAAQNDNRDIRAEVTQLIHQNKKLTRNKIATEVGISASAFSSWMSGTYAGNQETVETKIAQWLDNYRARQQRAKQLPAAPEFVHTPSAKRITSALSYAQLAGDIVVIYGAAGTSKSETCKNYGSKNPNVWRAVMTPATKTTVPALEEVALALGIGELTGGASKIQRAIVRKMKGTNGLLIIDEAQHLGVDALDEMRSIHDALEGGIGLALVGNEQVYARMTGNNRAAYLDRLFSRIGKRVRLVRPSQDDIDQLVSAWGTKGKECIGMCREIASKPGGLRVLTKVLRLATLYAAGGSRELCCDDIRAAYNELGAEA